MSQAQIEQTLQTILCQLHSSSQHYMMASNRQDGALTAMEIAKILSSQGHSLNIEGRRDQSGLRKEHIPHCL